MPNVKAFLTIIFGLLIPAGLAAQQDTTYKVTRLTDHIYELSTDGGGYTVKVIASVGDDGILLVDTGEKRTAASLKKAIESLKNETPKYIINTHEHIEHIAGNYIFGKDPIIIGHTNLRIKMRKGSFLFEEFPDESLPEITFDDSLSIYFNGEEIKLVALPGSHSSSDIIVYFTKSKIACVGALSNGHHFPSVDTDGGDALKFDELVGRLIAILPDDVIIVPSHGDDGGMADLRTFRDMIQKTTEIVRAQVAAGKDAAALQQENALKDWASFDGNYVNRDAWIQLLVAGLNPAGSNNQVDVVTPMYYALRDKGIDSAIVLFYELRNKNGDTNGFFGSLANFIGYKLFANGKYPESLRFFELAIKDYPKSPQAWINLYYVARNHQKMDNRKLAIKYFKESLKVKPDGNRSSEFLRELEKK